MATVSNDLGLGERQHGRDTPGLEVRNLSWLHYCPAKWYLAGLLPSLSLMSSMLNKGFRMSLGEESLEFQVEVLEFR